MEPSDNVLQRMDQHVSSWTAADDHRSVFLSCYRLMTANMLQAIGEPFFNDRDWVDRLLHHFADYYFEALTCFDCGNEVPAVWQQVHELTRKKELHKLQYLLLGINAHINYDLVLTLYDILYPEWNSLTPDARKSRYEDHCKVNEIIARTIDRVQDEILEPGDPVLYWVDEIFGRLDEYLLSQLIRHWRQEVWEKTMHMMGAASEAEREVLRQQLEKEVTRLGSMLALGQ